MQERQKSKEGLVNGLRKNWSDSAAGLPFRRLLFRCLSGGDSGVMTLVNCAGIQASPDGQVLTRTPRSTIQLQ